MTPEQLTRLSDAELFRLYDTPTTDPAFRAVDVVAEMARRHRLAEAQRLIDQASETDRD
jgi:hypothetical protein